MNNIRENWNEEDMDFIVGNFIRLACDSISSKVERATTHRVTIRKTISSVLACTRREIVVRDRGSETMAPAFFLIFVEQRGGFIV